MTSNLKFLTYGFNIVSVIFFISTSLYSQQLTNIDEMKTWNSCYLEASVFQCGEYSTEFLDKFLGNDLDANNWTTYLYGTNPNNVNARLHSNSSTDLFLDENVSVSDGTLKLSLKYEDVSIPNPIDGSLIERKLSAGTIYATKGYGYGKYSGRTKNPVYDGVWTTLWLWSIQEIDIFDALTSSGYGKASVYDGYNSDPKLEAHYELDNVNFDPTNWNVYSVDWTPFHIEFHIDDEETVSEPFWALYRYYDEDGYPLKVNCENNIIPAGVYYENPVYIEEEGTWMRICAWIASVRNCWGDPQCDDPTTNCESLGDSPSTDCGADIDPSGLPVDFEIDWIKFEERSYARSALTRNCTNECLGNNQICLELNDILLGRKSTLPNQSRITNISPLLNATANSTDCFEITNPNRPASVMVSIEYFDESLSSWVVKQVEYSTSPSGEPELLVVNNNCSYYICVIPEECTSNYSISIPDAEITPVSYVFDEISAKPEQQGKTCLDCFEISVPDSECHDVELTYEYCGEIKTTTNEICGFCNPQVIPELTIQHYGRLENNGNYGWCKYLYWDPRNINVWKDSNPCIKISNFNVRMKNRCEFDIEFVYEETCIGIPKLFKITFTDECCNFFRISPNPVRHNGQIELKLNAQENEFLDLLTSQGDTFIKIYNSDGQTIYSSKYDFKNSEIIDLSRFDLIVKLDYIEVVLISSTQKEPLFSEKVLLVKD